ncbi:hypothetical protein [Arenimonas daejeonensis]|uniref:hypothetical protein n=1 Tax=Arenimonas daejeonensis TaxID=370777 RepID=UPI00131520D3|nr:hypothetical protein [Arenimonas daejeonensis]
MAAFRERRPVYPQHYSQPADRYPPMPYPAAPPAPLAEAQARRGESGNATADAAAPAAKSEYRDSGLASRQQLGTGHGERRWDAATVTRFEREGSRPNQVLSVYYDATEALVARGVIPRRWPHAWDAPEAFPIGFAPDP